MTNSIKLFTIATALIITSPANSMGSEIVRITAELGRLHSLRQTIPAEIALLKDKLHSNGVSKEQVEYQLDRLTSMHDAAFCNESFILKNPAEINKVAEQMGYLRTKRDDLNLAIATQTAHLVHLETQLPTLSPAIKFLEAELASRDAR